MWWWTVGSNHSSLQKKGKDVGVKRHNMYMYSKDVHKQSNTIVRPRTITVSTLQMYVHVGVEWFALW